MDESVKFQRDFESDAKRYSEFCICTFDEAWGIIGICYDYASDETQYWENIREAVQTRQSYTPNMGLANVASLIRKSFEKRNPLIYSSGDQ